MTAGVLRLTPGGLYRHRRALRLIEHHATAYRRSWLIIVSGFFEPLFYLLSIGVGIGHLVGQVHVGAGTVGYTTFVAPGMLAASAMNGAVLDSTFNVFFRLRHAKLYDGILATPVGVGDVALGEIGWALLRGALYAAAFLVVMAALGLVHSWLAPLALPAALLVGFAFAAVGMAATCYMRSWQDFEYINLAVLPLFLFSATFYPLTTYPPALRLLVECTPLYHGVALLRGLTSGPAGITLLGHAGYLAVMGGIGLFAARRRLAALLTR